MSESTLKDGDPKPGDFVRESEERDQGVVAELCEFFIYRKKWWLVPIVIVLLLLGLVLLLSSSVVAPIIYPLF